MLGEFFAVDPADIDSVLLDKGPAGRFPTVEAKSVDSVSISTLGEILLTSAKLRKPSGAEPS
jgi:hypothetical protein